MSRPSQGQLGTKVHLCPFQAGRFSAPAFSVDCAGMKAVLRSSSVGSELLAGEDRCLETSCRVLGVVLRDATKEEVLGCFGS